MIDVAAEAGDAKIHVLLRENVAEIMTPVSVYECLFGNWFVTIVLEGFVKCVPPRVNTVNENTVKVKE